jgi:HEAT repeat protein
MAGIEHFRRFGHFRRFERFVHLVLLAGVIGAIFPSASLARQGAAQKAAPAMSAGPGASQAPANAKQQPAKSVGAPASNSPADAWKLLMQGESSTKFRDRSDAVSALTILDRDRKAISAIADALKDKEETIRVLAATSLGEIKARSAIPQLKDTMNNDKSPQVSFAAAEALWKMGDREGRDIFYEVLDGERKVKPGLLKSKMHEARMDMHNPKALALIGVNEASGAFLGPFSMGVSMVEEYAKNGGTSIQALCAQMLALDESRETVDELTYALDDKNWTVRAAAARSLAKLNVRAALPQLKDMMLNDKSQPARFAAAAAVIHLSGPSARTRTIAPKPPQPPSTPSPQSAPASATTTTTSN